MSESTIAQFLSDQRHLVKLEPGVTVGEAARIMKERHVGAVLVTDGGKLAGIFTERDVLDKVVAEARDPERVKVGEIMTSNPLSVTPETTVVSAMRTMRERHMRHLPVVRDGEILGIVSVRDMIQAVVAELADRAGLPAELWDNFQGIPV